MPIKVAVASSDGKIVNQHFGKAQKFLIFEINNNSEYEFIELRQTVPRCGEDPDIKYGTINLISDCDILLVSQIGPGAREKLLKKEVRPLIMPVFIKDALEEVFSLTQND